MENRIIDFSRLDKAIYILTLSNEQIKAVKKIFKEYATGIYSTEEIRKKYYSQLKIRLCGSLLN